jgi:hypothetical protein
MSLLLYKIQHVNLAQLHFDCLKSIPWVLEEYKHGLLHAKRNMVFLTEQKS